MRYLRAGACSLRGCAARPHSREGFTVLEIAIIVVVVAILASLAVVAYFRVTSKAENTEALNNLAAVRKAQVSELAETGTYVMQPIPKRSTKLLPMSIFRITVLPIRSSSALQRICRRCRRVGENATGQKPSRSHVFRRPRTIRILQDRLMKRYGRSSAADRRRRVSRGGSSGGMQEDLR
jgi:Tfp pilus assembly protein PilE